LKEGIMKGNKGFYGSEKKGVHYNKYDGHCIKQ
jgi:hypothetical protein